MKRATVFALVAWLAACSHPPQPDWKINAHSALEHYEKAYLTGRDRVAQTEFDRARTALTSTGDAGLVARGELTKCALQVASLDFQPCTGFEALRRDAPAAERAYADFLAGRLAPDQAALLPEAYRGVATAGDPTAALDGIKDAMSRVIAAGVVMRTGRARPETLRIAADTASAEGWRRPLLAWLGAQLKMAEQAGASDEAERLRRRIALAANER